jgi:hypothetical protein
MYVLPPLNAREYATVLAALSFYSEQSAIPASVLEIATDAGAFDDNPPSTADDIVDRIQFDHTFERLVIDVAAIRHKDLFTESHERKQSVANAIDKLQQLATVVERPAKPEAQG